MNSNFVILKGVNVAVFIHQHKFFLLVSDLILYFQISVSSPKMSSL